MKISHDGKTRKLWLFQEVFVERILERFNMGKARSVYSQLASHFNLSFRHCPTSEKEKQEMRRVLYALAVDSLMYVMVCIRPNIAHVVRVISRFLSNPGKQH